MYLIFPKSIGQSSLSTRGRLQDTVRKTQHRPFQIAFRMKQLARTSGAGVSNSPAFDPFGAEDDPS